ncbi:MAG: hypothetical protein LBQ15_09605 [Clostridium sp.]|jgi:hypothetical protein|nr:hypothetical protein [Clostridium sp.]
MAISYIECRVPEYAGKEEISMLEIQKIEDKSLNLDVQGQGCDDDCYIGAHWELKSDFSTPGCVRYNEAWTAVSTIFW